MGKIIGFFAGLAVFISCLGLLGLIAQVAQQRIKEIGIRKVLGASSRNIVGLLSIQYLKLVILSIAIASPLSWWIMRKWISDFAYRAEISWWIFVVAGLTAIFIALVTISFQTIRAAMANPIKSLKVE